MRFDEQSVALLHLAADSSRALGHSYVGSVHLLLAMSQSTGLAGLLLRSYGAEPGLVRCVAAGLFGAGTPHAGAAGEARAHSAVAAAPGKN